MNKQHLCRCSRRKAVVADENVAETWTNLAGRACCGPRWCMFDEERLGLHSSTDCQYRAHKLSCTDRVCLESCIILRTDFGSKLSATFLSIL